MGACRECGMAPEHVERPVSRHTEEPSAGVLRHARVRPLLQRLEQRILHDFFRQLQVGGTEDAREPGDQLPRAAAEQMVDELVRGHGSHYIDPADFEGLRSVRDATLAGFDLGKPLVCAINGHCRAVGLDMMLASEVRIAAPHATFALEEVALGLYPTGNATVLLPRQIGWVHAHELLLAARPIPAERALAIGLVNRIVPAAELQAYLPPS